MKAIPTMKLSAFSTYVNSDLYDFYLETRDLVGFFSSSSIWLVL